jgi:ribosome biogenesis GTPase A
LDIQWYPGHMAKARRLLQEKLPAVDIILEVVDARIPLISRNPDFDDLFAAKERIILLNKADLADESITKKWIKYYEQQGWYAIAVTAVRSNTRKLVMQFIEKTMRPRLEKLLREKGLRKVTRGMIVGIPNVGKSSLINTLAGGASAKTGNRPGVTRGTQLMRITPYLELLDTPGILWPKFDDQDLARDLAYCGSVKDEIMDTEKLCAGLLEKLAAEFPECITGRYGVPTEGDGYALTERIALKRGWIRAGSVPDCERAAMSILMEFRSGKMGRITLESPPGES